MHADLKGALAQINTSYRAFEHRGRKMTKDQVKKVLEYGISKGYTSTEHLSDNEVDDVLKSCAHKDCYKQTTCGDFCSEHCNCRKSN